jgi:hypothetical protein
MSGRRPGPASVLLLLAPVLGEGLSTATPPLELLLPWNLALFVALYGCGALLCRELARRSGLGVLGLGLLAAAYAVYEEALVDRFWFTPDHWHDTGLDDYSEVWHVNVLLATHLTIFHVAVSMGASIVLVDRLFPGRHDRPWVGGRSLIAAAAVFLVVPPLLYGEYSVQPLAQLLAAAGLMVVLVVLAFRVTRRPRLRGWVPPVAGWIAFACTGTHFVLTYAVSSMGLSWPLGLVVALTPVALGVALLRNVDALRVVTGVLSFFCLLCTVIGLGGRYDTTVLGLVVAAGLVWLKRRTGRTSA